MKNNHTVSATPESLCWPIPVLKENLHYYMENGFMVFTEAYHSAGDAAVMPVVIARLNTQM
jgi:hypothetical protein